MIHLHGHSTFSFLDGYGLPEQIAERVQELGHQSCAITDHGNIFAHVPYQREFRKKGLKPIFGCEFYVVENMRERTKTQEILGANVYPHVTVFAQTLQGYKNLLRLSRLSWEEGFYYKPRIDWDELARFQEGLVVLSGCVGGFPSRLILGKGISEAHAFISQRRQEIQQYYIELIPEPGLTESINTIVPLCQIAIDLKIPCVMTADAHFPKASDHEAEDLMLCVGIRKQLKDPARTLQLPAYQFYCSQDELLQRALDCTTTQLQEAYKPIYEQALQNTELIAQSCEEIEIPRASGVVFPGLSFGETAEQRLWTEVTKGFQRRQFQLSADTSAYHERASREFKVIASKGFCDYHLAIADVVQEMKGRGSLVMCRGSAGGCLLLWLLGASETDPLRHDLSFERFYDDTRPDPPDVDLDFEKGFRNQAIQYVYDKYGRENCSQLAALSRIGAKAALQDAAFAYGIPRYKISALSAALDSKDADVDRQLFEITEPEALATLKEFPQLHIIDKLVGQYRQQSVHAAGVIISPTPLEHHIGVVVDKDKQPIAAVDKKGAAELGFLKMDFLSVQALDVIANTVRSLNLPLDWLYQLPLDDQEALNLGNRGFLAGIFQLDGFSAARVSREIGISHFSDIYAAGALCRPGPGDWVGTYSKNKKVPIALQEYLAQLAPQAATIVQSTYGILLYQEQVMRLARELAGLSWADVHKLRKGVVDKLGLDPQKGDAWRAEWSEKFLSGCQAQGIEAKEAEFWWKSIQSHGGYSFNRSHCVTYGLIGYWMLYLKAHHPGHFYEAYLQLEQDELLIKRLIREFKLLGGTITLLAPSSQANFTRVGDWALTGGWLNLKGVGPATAAKILSQGPFETWEQLWPHLPKALASKLEGAGLRSSIRVSETIQLAPWFPVTSLSSQEEHTRSTRGLAHLGSLKPALPSAGDTLVSGFLTYLDDSRGKLWLTLEDEHAAITCRVPAKLVNQLSAKFRALPLGCFAAVSGWWTGETMFVKDCARIT